MSGLFLNVEFADDAVDAELTPTALRMLETLPVYYHGVPFFERILQALANRVDELDARVDELAAAIVPHTTSDARGLLSMWEAQVGLPVAPAGVSDEQRISALDAHLRGLGASSAADVLSSIAAILQTDAFTFLRNAPSVLHDVILIPAAPGGVLVTQVTRQATLKWPAHRVLSVSVGGFLHDLSQHDVDTL